MLARHSIHPTRVTTRKRSLFDRLAGVFADKVMKVEDNEAEAKYLHAKIGKLSVEKIIYPNGLKRCARANKKSRLMPLTGRVLREVERPLDKAPEGALRARMVEMIELMN